MKTPQIFDVNITRTGDGTVWAIITLEEEIATFYFGEDSLGNHSWLGGYAQQKGNSVRLLGELNKDSIMALNFHLDAFLDRERVSGT